MTDLYSIYLAVSRELFGCDQFPPATESEMRAIVAARTVWIAAREIDWWGCWGERHIGGDGTRRRVTATMFARRVREEAGR